MAGPSRRPVVLTLILVILVIVVPIIGAWVGLRWLTDTPGRSFRGQLPSPTPIETTLAERLRGHVQTIAGSERNISRNRAKLDEAARYLEEALAGMGYAVENQRYMAGGHTVRNIAVSLGPNGASPDTPTLVVGAHYDSVPGSPGANDNASGVAALIELARQFADLRDTTSARLRLVFFVNEEPPYFRTPDMGSFRYAMMLAERRERVVAMYSLETIGFFSDRPKSQRYPFPLGLMYPNQGDFVAFVSTTASRQLVRESIKAFRDTTPFPSEGGSAPGSIPGIDWSDHWSFEQFDYPAIMITDTALFRYPYYHTAEDTPDKVDYDKLARVTFGVERMIRDKLSSLR